MLLLAAILSVGSSSAQVLQRPPAQQQRPDPADTIPVRAFRFDPPVPPLLALGQSILLPGWGQAVLGRRGSGAFFVFWEGLALTMAVKSLHQLRYQESIGWPNDSLDNKRAELQDWVVVLVFNHLVAGAEAFVSANLWDFPADLGARALPGGAMGFGINVSVGAGCVQPKRTRAARAPRK
jgi:hypothetical protein